MQCRWGKTEDIQWKSEKKAFIFTFCKTWYRKSGLCLVMFPRWIDKLKASTSTDSNVMHFDSCKLQTPDTINRIEFRIHDTSLKKIALCILALQQQQQQQECLTDILLYFVKGSKSYWFKELQSKKEGLLLTEMIELFLLIQVIFTMNYCRVGSQENYNIRSDTTTLLLLTPFNHSTWDPNHICA